MTQKLHQKGQILRRGQIAEDAELVTSQVAGNPLLIQGAAVGVDSNHILRSMRFRLRPGATPGTNINVGDNPTTPEIYQYNAPVLTDATDLAASSTAGSYSLDAGNTITVNTAEKVVGILSASFLMHDLNSSSTSELYTPWPSIVSGALTLAIIKRGATQPVSWLTILDSGDEGQMQVCFITDS